ncbi:uncharacterized protein LOC141537484 [Cotesia typhae]|uniref:uncharacterized protein LOC141537484 n=1 Tax=Cotesia typhae TaxID=2053667 RepID=UPI003D68369E
MFKLIVVAGVLAVAAAAPGGLTGIHIDHGLGPIHAPHIFSHVDHHAHAHVVHSAPAVAPQVHVAPIVTKTVLPAVHGHGHGYGHAFAHAHAPAPVLLAHHDFHGLGHY